MDSAGLSAQRQHCSSKSCKADQSVSASEFTEWHCLSKQVDMIRFLHLLQEDVSMKELLERSWSDAIGWNMHQFLVYISFTSSSSQSFKSPDLGDAYHLKPALVLALTQPTLCFLLVQCPRIIESYHIPRWKGPQKIIESNSWLHTGPLKNLREFTFLTDMVGRNIRAKSSLDMCIKLHWSIDSAEPRELCRWSDVWKVMVVRWSC